ncbi:MAG: DUF481 domain-containing protein [Bacteroidia bacterium]
MKNDRLGIIRSFWSRHAFIFFIFNVSFFISNAQIINTERLRLNAADQGWSGTVSLSADVVQNVKKSTRLGLLTGAEYVKKRNRFLVLGNYKLNRIDGNIGQNQGYGHLRYGYQLSRRWTAEGFVQLQFNAVQLLRLRMLEGAGFRYRFADTDTFRCFAGSLYMYEYEELNDDAGTFHRHHRQSSYFSMGFRVGDHARLDHVSYFQPRWAHLADFRISTETRLQVEITEKLALRTSFYLLYDSRPPEGLPTTYYTLSNSLSWGL